MGRNQVAATQRPRGALRRPADRPLRDHRRREGRNLVKVICLMLVIGVAAIAQAPPSAEPPSADEQRTIEKKMSELASRVGALARKKVDPSLLADVDIFRKAAEYILRFPEEFATKAFIPNTTAVLDTGLTRARELEAGA